MRKTNSAIKQL